MIEFLDGALPSDWGIEMWIDENGRLMISDPSFLINAQTNFADLTQPEPKPFRLPIGQFEIVFEHKLTLKGRRVFLAIEILPSDCQKLNQLPLWSDVLGLRRTAF